MDNTNEINKAGGKYKCSVCGYEDPASKDEFEQFPDDYQCPMCGVGKNLFELVQ